MAHLEHAAAQRWPRNPLRAARASMAVALAAAAGVVVPRVAQAAPALVRTASTVDEATPGAQLSADATSTSTPDVYAVSPPSAVEGATVTRPLADHLGPALDLGPDPIELDAERLRAEPSLGVYVAEGHAVLRRRGLTVFADRLFLDRATGAVVAEGNVVVVEGPAVLSCARVVLSVPGLDGAIDDAVLRVKRGRARTSSAEAAVSEGLDTMRLSAHRLVRTGPRSFELDDADFTPCRCAEGTPPDWKLGASSAAVDVDTGAWLFAPVLYVRDLPVMILPVLYVPLGERRTGLLLPSGGYTSAQGLELTLPLYVTLGRSWDATLEAGWWFDRGAAPGLELRWAPSAHHSGALHATLLLDQGVSDGGGWSPDRADVLPRFAITGRHRGRVDDVSVAADVNVVGDLDFVREFGGELLERQVESSVSRLTVASWAGDRLRVAGGLALRQDLRAIDYGNPVERRLVRLLDPSFEIAHRFAELRIDALPYPLFEGVASPLARARLIADATGTFRDVGEVVGRADFRPSLLWPLAAHGLSLVPEAALRLSGTTRAGGGESEGRIAGVLHTTASIELHHRYGDVTHVLRPRARHTVIALLSGEARDPGPLDDELSVLGPAHQLVLGLDNELYLAGRATRLASLELLFPRDLRRELDRTPLMLANAELATPIPIGSLRLTARVEVDAEPVEVSEWRVSASASWSAIGSAALTYASLGTSPPLATLIGGEEETYGGIVPLPSPWSAFRGIVASLSVTPVAPLRVDLSAFLDLDTPEGARGGALRLLRGAVAWTSPCECWSARVVVEKSSDRDLPTVQLSLDLAQVGGTGF